jgi:hypothetical protein
VAVTFRLKLVRAARGKLRATKVGRIHRGQNKKAQPRGCAFCISKPSIQSVHGVDDEISAAHKQDRNPNPQQKNRHCYLHKLPHLSNRGE